MTESLGAERARAGQIGQPTDGPRPRDSGVLESGEGWCSPSSRCPNSVIRARLPPQGVCSSAISVFVVSSRPATEAPFCSAAATDPQRVDDAEVDHVAVTALESVEPLVDSERGHLGDDLGAVMTRVGGDEVRRLRGEPTHVSTPMA